MALEVVYNVQDSGFGEDRYAEEIERVFPHFHVYTLSLCFCVLVTPLEMPLTEQQQEALCRWKRDGLLLDYAIRNVHRQLLYDE